MLQYTTDMKRKLLKLLEQYGLDNKISQTKLSKLFGVHRTTLNHWFNNKFLPNDIWAHQIKKFLKEKGVKI